MSSLSKNSPERPKRVLVFSLTHKPFIGGAEIAVEEITKRLPHYEFDMITLRFDKSLPKKEKVGNIQVYRIGFVGRRSLHSRSSITFPLSLNKFLFPVMAFFKAVSLHRRRKYDAIWAIMAAYAGFAALFFKILNPKTPYILTLQEGDPIKHIHRKARFVHPLWRQIFMKANIVQAISSYLGSFARDVGYRKTLEIIPNGVDLTLFSRSCRPFGVEHLKNTLGKKTYLSRQVDGIPPTEDDVFLVTASRLVPKNGVQDIINSLVYLPKNISLLIIGDGFLMGKLKKLVDEKNLEDRVKFLGFIPHEELPNHLCIADIFIRPSLSEGFGNSFIEAMAVRVPVIATPVGGITDFLFDPYKNVEKPSTGLFCLPNNPKSIAYNVRLLLSDKRLRDKISDNAEKMVREKYDWTIIANDMDQRVFKKVML